MKRKLLLIHVAIALAFVAWRWGRESAPEHPDHAPLSEAAYARLAATKRVDPRTLERGSISGNVRDENKQPIATATVCADIKDAELPSSLRGESVCTSTDAHGAYTLRELLASSYQIVAGAKTFRPSTLEKAIALTPGAHRTDVDFVLSAGGVEITGTVSDVSGGPIARARVRADGPPVETDERGGFSLWTAPGDADVSARADGYVSARTSCSASCRVEMLLTPEASIAGTVVDGQTGAVIAGAQIRVDHADWSSNGSGGEDRTDATGSFRVGRLLPSRYEVNVTADHAYGRSDGSILVGLGESIGGVVVKVFPAARITGKVMIAGSPARVCVGGDVWLRPAVRFLFTPTRTADDGTIVADGVLPDTYEARPSCDGYVARESYPPIVVGAADITGLTWEVEPGATVRGRISNRRGQPIAHAVIRARTEGFGPRPRGQGEDARGDRDGRYELTGLLPGSYRIQIASDDAEGSYTLDVAAGATIDKDWILDDVAALSGTIVDAEGHPVSGATVSAMLGDRTAAFSSASDADGGLRIALGAGEYTLRATRGNATLDLGDPDGVRVTVHADKLTRIKLVAKLDRGTIRGAVVDGSGAGVADAYVLATIEGGEGGSWMLRNGYSSVRPILAGTDGSFTLTGLPPGSYAVRAYRPGGGEAVAEKVQTGATLRLEIKSTGSVEGVVVVRGARPPLEIRVAADNPDTGVMRSETLFRTDGRFTVRDLPPGRYRITVDSPAARAAVVLDVLPNEHKRGVVLELTPLITLTGRVVDIRTGAPVTGVRMAASLVDGSYLDYVGGSGRGSHVSGADGRFAIARVSPGRLHIGGDGDGVGMLELVRTVSGSGSFDLGDLAIARARLQEGDEPGELGAVLAQKAAGQTVRAIVPRSSAEKAGLRVGDVISTIDGIDVSGDRAQHVTALLTAPVGTRVLLGLARGVTVPVILGPSTSP